jgi:transmembrane sensor
MERPVRAKFNRQIYEEACEWFIECRAGDLDDTARAEFDRWLRKSPEHQGAYLEIAAIWNEGPALDPTHRWKLGTLIAQAAEDPANVVPLERTPRATSHTPQHVPSHEHNIQGTGRGPRNGRVRKSQDLHDRSGAETREGEGQEIAITRTATHTRRRLLSIAASILLATVALGTYLLAPRGVYATTLGEQRSLALPDGSTVQLNSLSKVHIRYTEHERTVDLLQGQALFHVAKDTSRPFIVHSGETRVRAVGTQFDVYRKTASTLVTVVEGRVAILGAQNPESPVPGTEHAQWEGEGQPNSDRGTPATALEATTPVGSILLAAGEQITLTPKAARRTLHPNVASATAWTQRQLVFESASLTDVADEFNRYNERKLVIDPSALGSLHISGVFSSTDPASLIRFLRDRPGLRVTETPTQIRVEQDL